MTAVDGVKNRIVGACGAPGQGPHMVLVLTLEGAAIMQAQYMTYGCPAAQACGQYMTEVLTGASVISAREISEESIIQGVGQMPLGREHCPGMTITALKNALSQIDPQAAQA